MDNETRDHIDRGFQNLSSIINTRFDSVDGKIEKIDLKLEHTAEQTIINSTEIVHLKEEIKEKHELSTKSIDGCFSKIRVHKEEVDKDIEKLKPEILKEAGKDSKILLYSTAVAAYGTLALLVVSYFLKQ